MTMNWTQDSDYVLTARSLALRHRWRNNQQVRDVPSRHKLQRRLRGISLGSASRPKA